MADEETTPENVEETPAPEAASTEAAPEPAAPAAEPQAILTPKERKVASRARRGQRRPATPEERTELRKAKAKARSRRRKQEREKRAASGVKGEGTPPRVRGEDEGRKKVRLGHVVSAKADKTITVRIDTARRHRKYEKIVRSSSTLHAHDEENTANAGDLVKVEESRPLSRTKRWRLVEIMERAK